MKKWINVLPVVTVVSLAALTGCGDAKEGDGASGSNNVQPAEKPVTYNMLFNLGIPEYPENGGEAKAKVQGALEKAGIKGVDYKVSLLAGTEYTTKLNLLASSGELPDYFSVDSTTLAQFVSQGLVKPVDDLLAKAPNLMKMIPKERWEGVTFDGKKYAIPYGVMEGSLNSPNTGGLLVRQDWLDNLGLKMPTTLDELHATLKAFTNNDPDKNGQKDTYGLGGYKDSKFNVVFGAFGISPTYWVEKEGKIVKGFTTPEAKQALAVLAQWYKEGLIDPEFPVMELKQHESKQINSKIGIFEGDGFNVNPKGSGVPEALLKATPTAKLVLAAPPKGPNGKLGYPEVNPYAGGGLRAISAKAKDPEKLIRVLDWSVSEEGGINLVTYGEENVDYTYDKAKNFIAMKSTYTELYKKGYSNPIRFVQVTDRRWTEEVVRAALDTASKNLIKNALWKTVPAELDYPDLEKKLWLEYFVKIVTGTWPVDKFDEFVQKYYQQGGQTIEKQANEEWKKRK
ncbi:hypothetical protein [Paenibacillus flagellatus]|uniref:ABC transporter substrate-binding protein n=1 Tax=Paenibacillus flagellatus TaxID=2211139 RepID=A0A2V5K9Z3_9BACL|nr:hypothetical protein [Paenibacillus flagellatus]PYI55712.1 hypothetical protein DLM86_08275 [Paenibacillus flagellatus]